MVDGVAPFRPVERDDEHVAVPRHTNHEATLRLPSREPWPSQLCLGVGGGKVRRGPCRTSRRCRFHVPEPSARPGEQPDFSYVVVPDAGAVRRPDVHVDPAEIRDLAYDLIRVLDDDGRAQRPVGAGASTATRSARACGRW